MTKPAYTLWLSAPLFFMLLVLLYPVPVNAEEDSWLIGKWELHFDPDGAKKDFIDFKQDGDVISSGHLGKLEGLYIVSETQVKAVFTYNDKDFIMTFFFNPAKDELRIVTSHTGRESIYKKIN